MGQVKVLVVDDDLHMRALCRRILDKEGYVVCCASSAQEALELWDESFTVIVTDAQMPGMDGLTLVRQLRQRHAQTPVIMVSGGAGCNQMAELRQLGIKAYLKKPFSTKELVALIGQAV